jgi:hypothetical protein
MRGRQRGQAVQRVVDVGRERAVGLRQRLAVAVGVVAVGVDAAGRVLDALQAREVVEGVVRDQAERGQDGRELRTIASRVVLEF